MEEKQPKYKEGDILITNTGEPFEVTDINKYLNGGYWYSSSLCEIFGKREDELFTSLDEYVIFVSRQAYIKYDEYVSQRKVS